jgi:hypothetical protein
MNDPKIDDENRVLFKNQVTKTKISSQEISELNQRFAVIVNRLLLVLASDRTFAVRTDLIKIGVLYKDKTTKPLDLILLSRSEVLINNIRLLILRAAIIASQTIVDEDSEGVVDSEDAKLDAFDIYKLEIKEHFERVSQLYEQLIDACAGLREDDLDNIQFRLGRNKLILEG